MNIVEEVKKGIINLCEEYKNSSSDHYDFWNEHIKYVYEEGVELARKYGANVEIVSLGCLLHDIALIKKHAEHSYSPGRHRHKAVDVRALGMTAIIRPLLPNALSFKGRHMAHACDGHLYKSLFVE